MKWPQQRKNINKNQRKGDEVFQEWKEHIHLALDSSNKISVVDK